MIPATYEVRLPLGRKTFTFRTADKAEAFTLARECAHMGHGVTVWQTIGTVTTRVFRAEWMSGD